MYETVYNVTPAVPKARSAQIPGARRPELNILLGGTYCLCVLSTAVVGLLMSSSFRWRVRF